MSSEQRHPKLVHDTKYTFSCNMNSVFNGPACLVLRSSAVTLHSTASNSTTLCMPNNAIPEEMSVINLLDSFSQIFMEPCA